MAVEIDDLMAADDLDVEEIMRRIRAHIAARGGIVEPVEVTGRPQPGGRLARSLAGALADASRAAGDVAVTMNVTRTPTPVLGPILDGLRAKVHRLVIFYVNQMAARQMAFNAQVMRTLTALISELDAGTIAGPELEALRRDLRDLRSACGPRSPDLQTPPLTGAKK